MKTIIYVLILFFSVTSLSLAQFRHMYYPDGTRYEGTSKSYNQLDSELVAGIPIHLYLTPNADGTVGFKMFTDTPVWVDTEHPEDIKELIASFDLSEYLHGWQFENDLRSCIQKRNLTDLYLLQSLGAPDRKVSMGSAEQALEEWYYRDLGAFLYLDQGIVTRYVKVN